MTAWFRDTANDALTGDDLYTYSYDDEGRRAFRVNRSTLDTSTSTWDALDQLVELEDEAADTWTFEYDALGRRTRVAKTGTGAFDWVFVYGANNLVSAVFEAGESTPLMTYRTGEQFGEVLAEVRGATERYALRDRLGTTVGWLDDAGDVDEEIARDGYGNRAVAATEVVAFGYTGHAEDPTGLVWGRARYLDATIGAWTAEDPVFTEGRTAYVSGQALTALDPDGRDAISEAITRCWETAKGYIAANAGVDFVISPLATGIAKAAAAQMSPQALGTFTHVGSGAQVGGGNVIKVPGMGPRIPDGFIPDTGGGGVVLELKKCNPREIARGLRYLTRIQAGLASAGSTYELILVLYAL